MDALFRSETADIEELFGLWPDARGPSEECSVHAVVKMAALKRGAEASDDRIEESLYKNALDAVARLVGIEGGVVSGVFNLESSGVRAVGLETTP